MSPHQDHQGPASSHRPPPTPARCRRKQAGERTTEPGSGPSSAPVCKGQHLRSSFSHLPQGATGGRGEGHAGVVK